MMKEIWKDIEGFEGKYQISNLGRVKSLNYRKTGKEKILKLTKDKKGYLRISLKNNKKLKGFKVHRLVAETFISNPDNLDQVNHKDENKQNNSIQNLEWCDNRYNKRYSSAKKVACFKNNKLIKVYDTIIDTEKDGFKISAVCQCCIGNRNSHHSYQWRYID